MKSKWLRVLTLGLVASLMVSGCTCKCQGWGPVTVSWAYQGSYTNSNVPCGGAIAIDVDSCSWVTVTSAMGCTPFCCHPDYSWVVKEGASVYASGTGLPASFYACDDNLGFHAYDVTLSAWCKDYGVCKSVQCLNCTVRLNVTCVNVSNCTCHPDGQPTVWNPVTVTWIGSVGSPKTVQCGAHVGEITVTPGTSITVSSSVNCYGSSDCTPLYWWDIETLWGNPPTSPIPPKSPGTSSSCDVVFTPGSGTSAYAINLHAKCYDGSTQDICDNCTIYMNVTNGTVTGNCTCTHPTVWNDVVVHWTGGSDGDGGPHGWQGKCGESIIGGILLYKSPDPTITVDSSIASGCTGSCPGSAKCQPLYTWDIDTISGSSPNPSSSAVPSPSCHVVFLPGSGTSAYRVTLHANCGCDNQITEFCDDCIIYMNVTNVTNCTCTHPTEWYPVEVSWIGNGIGTGSPKTIQCGGSVSGITVTPSQPAIIVESRVHCCPDTYECTPSYICYVYKDGEATPYKKGTSLNQAYIKFDADAGVHSYTVTFQGTCSDGQSTDLCENCTIYLDNVTRALLVT